MARYAEDRSVLLAKRDPFFTPFLRAIRPGGHTNPDGSAPAAPMPETGRVGSQPKTGRRASRWQGSAASEGRRSC